MIFLLVAVRRPAGAAKHQLLVSFPLAVSILDFHLCYREFTNLVNLMYLIFNIHNNFLCCAVTTRTVLHFHNIVACSTFAFIKT